ncbi:TolC family protein [Mediterranea massiliensis]|uniref:TolC family protein n=2 Tax=Mediterranea massiliensis TaxID=1841865 RepID=A0ABS2E201_9BACT|nr:TolC family protein [Mediterranea massiliensis]
MFRRILLLIAGACGMEAAAPAQEALELTLQQTIRHAQEQSPDAQSARHSFRSSYWNYRYYRANYLPNLTLTSTPYLDRAINKVTLGDGSVKFVEQNLLSTNLTLSLTQNVPWTGGTFFVETSAQRIDLFSDNSHSYQTSPVNIGYTQSLFGYNSLKWNRRIEPVRYREARKRYAETLELVAAAATQKFFALATAQSNYEIACTNYANADTLYIYARGRYDIGTISENEMLQLEINKLTEETNRMNARIEVDNAMQELRSYLGIQQDVDLKVRIEDFVPDLQIDLNEALLLAAQNSPDIENMQRRRLESESAVAQARANAGLKADIYLRFGLTQTADRWKNAWRNPMDQQYVSLSVSLPILDWGRGKGQVRVAKSNRDLVQTQVEQDKTDFDLNIRKLVKQFNLQAQRVHIAARTDTTAQRRADVARRLYLLGQSTILDLNASITEKDSARRNYVTALYDYWSLYYTLRSLTLYDFRQDQPLEEDLERLIK